MNKVILLLIITVLIACFILVKKGNTLREIQAEIEISASPAEVWNVLTDVNGWNAWNPITTKATGNAAVGSILTITMRGEGNKKGPEYSPVITVLKKPELFEWRAKMMSEFLFTNGRVFKLEKSDKGTLLTNKETFRGMLVPLFWSKFQDHVPSMLNEMNEALKNQVER